MNAPIAVYKPHHNIRIITATSLFDGHDASTNIMRRILQDSGVEVIHLAHNRSVQELVKTAIEEDAQGIAMSSYQGGHVEAFKYMIDLLRENGASHIRVFGGGGGVIVADEIKELEAYGVTKIYSPEDGAAMGLQGMANHMIECMDFSTLDFHQLHPEKLNKNDTKELAGFITAVQHAKAADPETLAELLSAIELQARHNNPPVIGVTGTGGAGKSSLTDEIIVRFLHDNKDMPIAVICCDPSRRKTGGALLGDRIRMNSISNFPSVYMRSLATRDSANEVSEALPEAIQAAKAAGFALIIAETAGIGQGDSRITDLADISIYVMTSDYGAPSQLEKIDMLDYADIIVVNKFEKKAVTMLSGIFASRCSVTEKAGKPPLNSSRYTAPSPQNSMTMGLPRFITASSISSTPRLGPVSARHCSVRSESVIIKAIVIPTDRTRYLSEISETVRQYHAKTAQQAGAVRNVWHLSEGIRLLSSTAGDGAGAAIKLLAREKEVQALAVEKETEELISTWEKTRDAYTQDELVYEIRGREIRVALYTLSLSHSRIPKIALPKFTDPAEIYSWRRRENLPGSFPYTGGVFPLKRMEEDPTRMFAGEGGPAQTNRRFKLLSENYAAKRLSTAFDSVTLYGWDPAERPDIYGKIGTSGVSICTLDDVKVLYDGFDLCSPTTSVSMTINGPAPIILAMFMNCAIDQQIEKFTAENGCKPDDSEAKEIEKQVLTNVRGTVQADILKEDQGQNTCIFSIEFALK